MEALQEFHSLGPAIFAEKYLIFVLATSYL